MNSFWPRLFEFPAKMTPTMKTAARSLPTRTRSQNVRHLRSQGSFLYKRSSNQHLIMVGAKGDVNDIPDNRVTEAFGVENWPHLLHMLEDGGMILKKRVLTAMTEVFKSPQELAMCLKHGLLELIQNGLLDTDVDITELSANVLSVMLEASSGRMAFASSDVAIHILPVFSAAVHLPTTIHLYDALLSVSRPFIGAQLLTRNQFLLAVIGHLKRNSSSDELQMRALRLLKNLVNDGDEGTVFKAIDLEAVELCARHLYDGHPGLRVAASDTIAALACVDKAKKITVDKGVVKKLCMLLSDRQWQVCAASAGALMNLAAYDEAKRHIVANEGLASINHLLQSSKYLAQLNTVKLVTVMASYPPARKQLNVSSTEYHLRSLMGDADALLAKSARTALHAVQWQP